MTMFEELFALACSATLTMTVSADEKSGRLTVNVIPKPRQDAGEPGLTQPLSLTATPQEFDAGFIEALRGYREVRQSLAQQAEATKEVIEATKEVIEAAKASSVKKASDATVKAGASKSAPAKPVTAPAVSASGGSADDEEEDAALQAAGATPATAATAGGESFDLFG